ncbi:MAG: pyridoxal phosphate-dependent aminotransferase, partial [Promethearchaeota archaeon]
MNLDSVINLKKKNLKHNSHGGEIYNNNLLNKAFPLIDFSTNVNPLVTPDIFSQTYKQSLEKVPVYPDSKSTQLKRELIKYFLNKISSENLIVGAGAMELILTFSDMFINPEDEIIIAQPTFTEYAWAIQKNGGVIVNVYRKPENNFRIEVEPLINKITPKTKIIFICNPNNPNGYLDNPEDLKKIISVASLNDILVFLDEAFIEFTGEHNSFVNGISSFDNLFICRTFTKFFGLTGLRIGYGISSSDIINFLNRGQILWSVNCIGQILAQEILKSKKFIEDSINYISKEIEFVKKELKIFQGLRLFPSDTNYLLINTEKTGIKSAKIKELLLKENILIRDCSNYDGLDDYYIRIGIKTRELNLK